MKNRTNSNAFTQEQLDWLTKCSDEPNTYKVNIDYSRKEIDIIDINLSKIMIHLGHFGTNVFEKLLDTADLRASHKEIKLMQ
jgi:hypothetical protein